MLIIVKHDCDIQDIVFWTVCGIGIEHKISCFVSSALIGWNFVFRVIFDTQAKLDYICIKLNEEDTRM